MTNSFPRHFPFLLLFCCFSGFALSGQQLVSEHFQATPLQEVFQVFGDKYGLLLAFDPGILHDKTVSITFEEEVIVTAFYQVLNQSGLDYLTLNKNQILVRPSITPPVTPVLSFRHLRGQVQDSLTGMPLAYATVYHPQFGLGVVTDERGNFSFEYSDTLGKTLRLEARYLGYSPKLLDATTGENCVFYLAALTQPVGTILVTDQPAALGLSAKELALLVRPRLSGLGGTVDPMRNLQLLPGVAAHNDLSAALQIRGGSADENLILWDGMLLYEVNHLFGAFSAVNGQMVGTINLYKNTYPIGYGGRTSSVVTIASIPPATARTKTMITLGSLLASANTNIPLTKGMALQIGARSSLNNLTKTDLFGVLEQNVTRSNYNSLNLLERSPQVMVQPAYHFYDANLKWTWQVSERTYLDLNAYRSVDHYEYDYSFDFRTRAQNTLLQNTTRFQEESDWKNTAFSLRWRQSWQSDWQSELTVSNSAYTINENNSTLLTRERPGQMLFTLSGSNQRKNQLNGTHINWHHQLKINNNHQLETGVRVTQERVELDIVTDTIPLLTNTGSAHQVALYAAHHWEKDKWSLQTGLHSTYYAGTGKIYPSPRWEVRYTANDNWQLKGAVSHYFQFLRRYYHENRFGRTFQIWTLADGMTFPVGNTTQVMTGFTYRKGNFLLDAEAYYKKNRGELEHTTTINQFEAEEDIAGGSRSYQLATGKGRVIGLDILLSQQWRNYNTWLSYTLSKSTRQFSDFFRGNSYAAQDDRPHQLQWINEYQYRKWTLGGTYVFASGRPYLDLEVAELEPNRSERNANTLRRIPAYHRVDLNLRYQYEHSKRFTIYGQLNILNVFNHTNTFYRQNIYTLEGENNRNLLLGNELQLLSRTYGVEIGFEF